MNTDFYAPPSLVYRDYRRGLNADVGFDWYRREVGQTWGVVYVCRDIDLASMHYIGSGNPSRPWRNSGYERVTMPIIEILAVTKWRRYATILESVIVEAFKPPGNRILQILPSDRHLMERESAIKFWNEEYADRFGGEIL